MHNILLSLLAFFARLIIQRHKPYIIGVTGTVGKTTITTHIAHFLTKQYWSKKIWYSQYHYNGEYGIPLTIIGAKTPWKNPFLWIFVFFIAITKLFRSYPNYLVLEYGIDHPGEMDFLLSIAIPTIAILTPVESNHLEQFGSLEVYRNNKLKLIKSAKYAIVHESLRQYLDTDVVYYSLGALSDIDASHIGISISGTSAIAHYDQRDFPLHVPAIGSFQIENILPLYPLSKILWIDMNLISEYASHSWPESGRSSLLPWIMSSTIIDGTYNGGYLSLREGIVSMKSFLHSHRIVFFLGDMRELWVASKDIHEKLAQDILDIIPHDANVSFYLVGPLMREYIYPILSKKFNVEVSLSSKKLGKLIAKDLKKNEVDAIVYAKWSQNTIFIEEWIKVLLKNQSDIQKLPRQSESWMNKKWAFFKSVED
jgi:UDP-N-acetylmuramyl pentapeptide synthase